MQCVILAGGLGTRIFPLTENIPKFLINVNNKPFADHQLSWMASNGVTNVVLCVAHLGQMIKDYVQDGKKWNIKVDYVDEKNNLLGTAGALRLALDQNKLDNVFLTINGDSFLPINFSKIYNHYINYNLNYQIQMTIFKNNGLWDNSNVLIRDNKIIYDKNYKYYDKSKFEYIDYGLYAIKKSILYDINPETKYCLSDLFTKLSINGLLASYECKERFFEVGSFNGIKDLEEYIKNDSIYNSR